MKKILFFIIMWCAGYNFIAAQKITTDKVPVLIYRSFKSHFPASNQESWSRETDAVYEVDFFNERKKQSATFDTSGAWISTETEINFNQVPHPVSAAFNKQFGGFTIQETIMLETADKGTLYEMIINRGNEGYEVEFSAKGELVKKEAAKPDGDD